VAIVLKAIEAWKSETNDSWAKDQAMACANIPPTVAETISNHEISAKAGAQLN
jgi:hypothetical protein